MYPFTSMPKAVRWSPIKSEESEDGIASDNEPFLVSEENMQARAGWTHRLRDFLPWALHAVLIWTYLTLGTRIIKTTDRECFDDQLLKPPIVWEQYHFESNVDIDRGTVNDTFGSSNPSTGEDWENSLDVGVIRITEEEMSRMPTETAHLYGGEDGYAGILEVFHQLHCLNRLRSRFQKGHNVTQDEIEHPHMAHAHDMHCFSYLWQTVKCHADVSVMSLEYNDEQEAFNARFDVVKQCRNFDVIHDWAKRRESKAKPPGGRHDKR